MLATKKKVNKKDFKNIEKRQWSSSGAEGCGTWGHWGERERERERARERERKRENEGKMGFPGKREPGPGG